ncbi:MAG: 30S ribosomal protein S9 [Planctomycetes bacterium]|nr:30S ribosomal protein S9 [Planctomycetota bacterium]
MSSNFTWGLGRRKTAVARVRVKSGAGGFMVNDREINEFFPVLAAQMRATEPLRATQTAGQYDVLVNVEGGGPISQAEAVTLGLARALKKLNPAFDAMLRQGGLLTRDSRMKERKKYGRRGARRGFQFSKR